MILAVTNEIGPGLGTGSRLATADVVVATGRRVVLSMLTCVAVKGGCGITVAKSPWHQRTEEMPVLDRRLSAQSIVNATADGGFA